MSTRWSGSDAPRGGDYDQQWERLAATGASVHGEADLVDLLCQEYELGRRVLDAGCGTGRVAIELAARGYETVGVDLDASMLDTARRKAPALDWRIADLATLELGRRFDAVVLAGNVMIFVDSGTEARVIAALCEHVDVDGLLIAGFQLVDGRLALADYDRAAQSAGLQLVAHYATWDRVEFAPGGDYVVAVHTKR